MRISRIIRRLLYRSRCFLEKLCSDIAFLFKSNKLFIYAWMKYKGTRLLHNNWGDDVNMFFIESISDLNVKDLSTSLLFKYFPVNVYSCIGSILGMFPLKRCEVWGSGLIEEGKLLERAPLRIHSVRGPLTRRELLKQGIECPEKYGDPALLISRYYRKHTEKKYKYGIIPHYTDENNPILIEFSKRHPEYLIIRMRGYDDWHDIPDQVMQCSRIISSSLHGLIIADSYEVPNAWVSFSDKIVGGDFKYQDYLQSVGRVIEVPYFIKTIDDLERIVTFDKTSLAVSIDYRSIFEACPFKDKIKDYEL